MAKVLVVDDAAFMRVRAAKVLTDNGHDVAQAENGLEAVKKYQEFQPDAVLMDITMPEMDGLAALKAGAKDFVLKPFQPDRVLAALQKILAA